MPFERPSDYFAEMMKDDEHMDKVKAKLLEAAERKKRSAEAVRSDCSSWNSTSLIKADEIGRASCRERV